MWYSSGRDVLANVIGIAVDKVKEIIELNKKGKKPDEIKDAGATPIVQETGFSNVVELEDLNRFDQKKGNQKPNNNRRRNNNKRRPQNQNKNRKPGNYKGNNNAKKQDQ